MGLISWFKEVFGEDDEDVHEDWEYACPKCGSTNLGYFSGLANYVQVIQGTEEPRYVQSVCCNDCGFKHKGSVDDENEYLEVLKKVEKCTKQ